jgi:hypothetical protein
MLINVMVQRGSEDRMLGVMISANENRHDDQLDIKLMKLQRYLDMGKTLDEAAVAFGVTITTVRNWMALLEGIPEIMQAVRAGKISATGAAKIAAMERSAQKEALDKLLASVAAGTKATAVKASRIRKATVENKKEIEPPSRKDLKGVVSLWAKGNIKFSCDDGEENTWTPDKAYKEGVYDAIRWVLGSVETQHIEGLEALLEINRAQRQKAREEIAAQKERRLEKGEDLRKRKRTSKYSSTKGPTNFEEDDELDLRAITEEDLASLGI